MRHERTNEEFLSCLRRNGPQTIKQVSDSLQIPYGQAYRVLHLLHDHKLVKRNRVAHDAAPTYEVGHVG